VEKEEPDGFLKGAFLGEIEKIVKHGFENSLSVNVKVFW
jgi:hypothetical protein